MLSAKKPTANDLLVPVPLAHPVLLPSLYFAIFSYPLSADEIHRLCPDQTLSLVDIQQQLDAYVAKGILYCLESFYLTQNEAEWVSRRKDNNQRAKRYLNRAYHVTQLIRRFPFVRAVFLSGALSKNVMPKDGDIDYFIVTEPGRLWVARTLLVLFKKLFLFNSHKYFCVNYFVDTQKLEIESKNRFTATEIVTLVPLYNATIYHEFLRTNDWTTAYFPLFPGRDTSKTLRDRSSKIQTFLEWGLKGKWGDRLDQYFLERTLSFWEKKFADFNPSRFTNALKSKKDVSKHHPQDFQTKVLAAFAENVTAFEQAHGLKIKSDSNLPSV